jgi:antitoxin YefM
MQATYRLRADEITDNFLKGLKDTYQDKEIEIVVNEVEDETAYLLKSEANRKQLLEAVEADKQGKAFRTMTIEEMESMRR